MKQAELEGRVLAKKGFCDALLCVVIEHGLILSFRVCQCPYIDRTGFQKAHRRHFGRLYATSTGVFVSLQELL